MMTTFYNEIGRELRAQVDFLREYLKERSLS